MKILFSLPNEFQTTLSLGWDRGKTTKKPRHECVNPQVNFYQTKDGKGLYLLFLPDDPYWALLCTAAERQELIDDERFNSREGRLKNNIELIKIIDGVFLEKTLDE